MKRTFNLTVAVRLLLVANVVLCIVAALAVFMVNGTGNLTPDHLCLLVLVIITAATGCLLKIPGLLHNKLLFWLSVFPLAFISYHAVFSSFISHHS